MSDPIFNACLDFTLLREVGNFPNGGYTNDPHDPGGETKFGISKRYHPNVDIKALTRDQAAKIYLSEYWIPSGAHALPWPYCLAVFDSCVIPGIGGTRTFIRAAEKDPKKSPFTKALIVCNERDAYFRRIVMKHPARERYLRGWLNRVNLLRKECTKLAP